jgi:hypothetical protein
MELLEYRECDFDIRVIKNQRRRVKNDCAELLTNGE